MALSVWKGHGHNIFKIL